ncbi:MAG TPA: hypothetical protein VGI33_09805 [Paenibacillus sp.]
MCSQGSNDYFEESGADIFCVQGTMFAAVILRFHQRVQRIAGVGEIVNLLYDVIRIVLAFEFIVVII